MKVIFLTLSIILTAFMAVAQTLPVIPRKQAPKEETSKKETSKTKPTNLPIERKKASDEPIEVEAKPVEQTFTRDEILRSRGRTDYALMIATDHYDHWDPLRGPTIDVQAIGELLERKYGFNVKYLIDPTKKEVLAGLNHYVNKSYSESDQLFIYIAGHGVTQYGDDYFVMKDSNKEPGRSTCISMKEIKSAAVHMPVKHLFLVTDAFCNTDNIEGSMPELDVVGTSGGSNTQYINSKLKYQARQFMMGCRWTETDLPVGSDQKFSSKFRTALENKFDVNDGLVTNEFIWLVTKQSAPLPNFRAFGDHQRGSDFIFEALPSIFTFTR